MPDTISLGSLSVPTVPLAVIGCLALSWLAGRLPLRRDKDGGRVFSDLFTAPLLPFLLGWKFSLLITDGKDVLARPSMLLYSAGETVNLLIGLLIGFGWLAYKMIRHHPRKELMAAMARSWGIFIVLALGLVFLFRPAPAQDRPDMPPVTLMRESGERWESTEAYGHPLILNFWASWCPPCRAEMPMLESFARDGKLGEATFWAVNAVNTEKSARAGRDWLTENDLDVPMLLDASGRAGQAYSVSALPTTIVLDAQGRLVARKTGAVSRSWLTRTLREARRL